MKLKDFIKSSLQPFSSKIGIIEIVEFEVNVDSQLNVVDEGLNKISFKVGLISRGE